MTGFERSNNTTHKKCKEWLPCSLSGFSPTKLDYNDYDLLFEEYTMLSGEYKFYDNKSKAHTMWNTPGQAGIRFIPLAKNIISWDKRNVSFGTMGQTELH